MWTFITGYHMLSPMDDRVDRSKEWYTKNWFDVTVKTSSHTNCCIVPNDTKHLTNESHGNFSPLASFTEPTPPSYTGRPRDLASCKDRNLWEALVSSNNFNLTSLIKPNTLIALSFPSPSSMTCGSCEDSLVGLTVEHSFLSFPMDWCHHLPAGAAAAAHCWYGWLQHDQVQESLQQTSVHGNLVQSDRGLPHR